jgi:methionine synthase II (cobalamin-independent)
MTDRAVKQALPGPYSVLRKAGRSATDVREGTVAVASSLRGVVEALAAAGCPLVEIEETAAHQIGEDDEERGLFREAHRTLAEGISGTHLSLSIVGGSAWGAGLETFAELPYASLALDLIAGSDNWNLITRLPAERGVIVGALPAHQSPADAKEMLLWAARYAAASSGRGLARVGLGSAGSWATLTWDAAVGKMQRLGEAAALAAGGGGENLARELDPRAVSARTAALGGLAPRPGAGRKVR